MFEQRQNRQLTHSTKWDLAYLRDIHPNLPEDYIPMWIADMDVPLAPYIQQALTERLSMGPLGYTLQAASATPAIQYWYARQNLEVPVEHIGMFPGGTPTFAMIAQAFCQKNDVVIVPDPVYGPFATIPDANGCRVIRWQLQEQGQRYDLDLEALARLFQQYQPKVLFFCHPHNPSGRIWSHDELERVYQLCQQYHVLMVIDEVHSDHILQGEFVSGLTLDQSADSLLLVLNSPSKGFNIAGLATTYCIVPNPHIRAKLFSQREALGFHGANCLGLSALAAAYSPEGAQWLVQCVAELREQACFVTDYLAEHLPNIRIFNLEASYLAWLDIRALGITSDQFVKELAEKTGVVLLSGTYFGPSGEGFVRMTIGTSRELLHDALDRLASYVAIKG